MERINILVVDDHRLMREGVQSYFESVDDMTVVADTANPYEALAYLKELQIHVAFLDVNMPIMNGAELCKMLLEHSPNLKVVALSVNNDYSNVNKMINAGATAYLLKDCSSRKVIDTVKQVLGGMSYYDSNLPASVLEKLTNTNTSKSGTTNKLTSKELEVLRLLMDEKSNAEIAEKLGIKVSTLNTHKSNLLLKTGSSNIVGLTKYVLYNNILDAD